MKKTRNYIRIVALLIAVVIVFTFPVSAEDYDNYWLSFFDYCADTPTELNFTSSGYLSYSFPSAVKIEHVQGVFQISGPEVTEVRYSVGSQTDTTYPLNLISIGDGLYRFYSSDRLGWIRRDYQLHFFSNSTSTTYVQLLSFDFTYVRSYSYPVPASLYLEYAGWTDSDSFSGGDPVGVSWDNSSADASEKLDRFVSNIVITDWKKYDYLDVSFTVRASAISSINVNLMDVGLPFEISYLNSNVSVPVYSGSLGSYNFSDYFGSSETENTIFKSECFSNIQLRIDLSNVSRNISGSIAVTINGSVFWANPCTVTLYGCLGYVSSNSYNPVVYWLQSVDDKLGSLHNSLGTWFDSVNDFQSQQLTEQQIIGQNILYIGEQISGYVYNVQQSIEDFQTSMETWFITVRDLMVSQYNNMVTYLTGKFKAVTDRLDKLIGGTTEGDELSQGAADLEDQVGDIHDFEQSQQAVLDNNFDAIQGAVTFTTFTAALAFVQRYINLSWAGIQGFSVIYTLPIFIGLFFFVCGRIPGATRWRSRPPKDGDSA